MTPEEKRILLKEIPKYIKENCYYTDGSIKYYDLWLVGWVAAEFEDRRNAAKVLISNEYGLLGNLLYKLMRDPDESITRFIERTDLEIILKALKENGIYSNVLLLCLRYPYKIYELLTSRLKYNSKRTHK